MQILTDRNASAERHHQWCQITADETLTLTLLSTSSPSQSVWYSNQGSLVNARGPVLAIRILQIRQRERISLGGQYSPVLSDRSTASSVVATGPRGQHHHKRKIRWWWFGTTLFSATRHRQASRSRERQRNGACRMDNFSESYTFSHYSMTRFINDRNWYWTITMTRMDAKSTIVSNHRSSRLLFSWFSIILQFFWLASGAGYYWLEAGCWPAAATTLHEAPEQRETYILKESIRKYY
jgi:hypothetical protein